MKNGNVDKCYKCGKDLTEKELKLAKIYGSNMCKPCRKQYSKQRYQRKVDVSEMPWYDDWILKEPAVFQLRDKKD